MANQLVTYQWSYSTTIIRSWRNGIIIILTSTAKHQVIYTPFIILHVLHNVSQCFVTDTISLYNSDALG